MKKGSQNIIRLFFFLFIFLLSSSNVWSLTIRADKITGVIGDKIIFTADVTMYPLGTFYIWSKNEVWLTTNMSSQFVVDIASECEAGEYKCVALFPSTGLTESSNIITISVIPPPPAVIVSDIPMIKNLAAGVNDTISFLIEGKNLTYEWYLVKNNKATRITDNANYSGTSSNILVISKVSSLQSGLYYCLAKTCKESYSSRICNYIVGPSIIKDAISSRKICPNSNFTISLDVLAENPVYRWYFYKLNIDSAINLSNNDKYAGANTSTLSLRGEDYAIGHYYCIISSPNSLYEVTSAGVNVAYKLLSITQQPPVSIKVPKSGTVNLSIKTKGEDVKYQWYRGILPILDAPGLYEGTDTGVLKLLGNALLDSSNQIYYCAVSNGCVNGDQFSTKTRIAVIQ